MKLTVYEPHEVEIPDSEIPELEKKIREEWGMKEGEEVADEDLLHMAENEGLVDLPEKWRYFD